MSNPEAETPDSRSCVSSPAIEIIIEAKSHSLGAFSVGRVLPSPAKSLIGPFIFFDHIGPAELPPGEGVSVRPHPHINLATVTYLFEGEILHRDSLGSVQLIEPGAINWMSAGRGITHSERSRPEDRDRASRIHGIQLWMALPKDHEEDAPSFAHHPAASLPELSIGGVTVRVLAGSVFGATSPVATVHPLVYAELRMPAGSDIEVPTDHPERAIYIASGEVHVDGETLHQQQMAVLAPGVATSVVANSDARVMLLTGATLDGPRHLWWNFVSSSQERIEQAKEDWKQKRFGTVIDDEEEFIPLPE